MPRLKTQKSIFAISDVHGCYEELKELVENLPLNSHSEIVFLGDYVDRGRDSRAVIDYILTLKKKYKVTCLKGNHEELFLEFLNNPLSPRASLFIYNGGTATLASYANEYGIYKIPEEHTHFLKHLDYYYETKDCVFVHAGLPDKKISDLNDKDYEALLWIRKPFLTSPFDWGKMIVHGHTPVDHPEVKVNRINIDTGCVFEGHLTALQWPEREFYQVKNKSELTHFYLRDKSSQRKAVRFSGIAPVSIERTGAEAPLELVATNYTDFGMLLKDQKNEGKILFQVGEHIKGQIGIKELSVFFEGQILNHEQKNNFYYYAVQFSKTPFDFLYESLHG